MDLRPLVLPLSAIVLAVGSAFVALSVMVGLLGMGDLVGFYVAVLPEIGGSKAGWNTVVLIAAPFVALTGGWYCWDQVKMRRDFNELIQTKKKSDFVREVGDLEDLARQLPPKYRERLEERKEELNL